MTSFLSPRRLSAMGAVAITSAALLAGPALAAWTKAVSGSSGNAKAASMPTTATQPTVSASGTSVTVSWTANNYQGTSSPVSAAKILRYSAATGGTGVTPGSACATQVASGCVETGVPLGDWYYSEKPSVGNWDGVESSRSAKVSVGSLSITSAGTGDRLDNGDTITIVFPSAIKESTLCGGASDGNGLSLTSTGNNGPLDVKVNNGTGGANDFITISSNTASCSNPLGLNFGSLDLGGTDYVTANTDFADPEGTGKHASKFVYTASTSTLVITLGTVSGTDKTTVAASTGAAVYTPPSSTTLKYNVTGSPNVTGTLTSSAGPLF